MAVVASSTRRSVIMMNRFQNRLERTKNEQALGRIVATFKCRFVFILRGIMRAPATIHDVFSRAPGPA
jgi:hypothetical protein